MSEEISEKRKYILHFSVTRHSIISKIIEKRRTAAKNAVAPAKATYYADVSEKLDM